MDPVRADAKPFTVFTPVYNRIALLARTFESLQAQTCRDFEWLIVDDGSSEDVSAQIARWRGDAGFPIVYVAQPHQGKPRAHNTALRHARGELFAVLDSDDELLPHAIERLLWYWNSIPSDLRDSYSGVTGLCLNERRELVGRPFPIDVLDCPHPDAIGTYGATGEKWGCHRTDILRGFPFPEIAGEEYCPEGLIWNRIGRTYSIRHVNEPLRIYHAGGMSSRLRALLMRNAEYARLFYRESIETDTTAWLKSKDVVNYVRYSFHRRNALPRVLRDSPAPALTAACTLPGYALYVFDCLRRGADCAGFYR